MGVQGHTLASTGGDTDIDIQTWARQQELSQSTALMKICTSQSGRKSRCKSLPAVEKLCGCGCMHPWTVICVTAFSIKFFASFRYATFCIVCDGDVYTRQPDCRLDSTALQLDQAQIGWTARYLRFGMPSQQLHVKNGSTERWEPLRRRHSAVLAVKPIALLESHDAPLSLLHSCRETAQCHGCYYKRHAYSTAPA